MLNLIDFSSVAVHIKRFKALAPARLYSKSKNSDYNDSRINHDNNKHT